VRHALAICSLCLIQAVPPQARADAPLRNNWVWVDLHVHNCWASTYTAPRGSSDEAGGKYRTAVISGTVVRSGFSGPAADPAAEARRAGGLPAPKSSVTYALGGWDKSTCQQVGVGVTRFRFAYDCDAGPSQGKCLSPYQLVVPASRPVP